MLTGLFCKKLKGVSPGVSDFFAVEFSGTREAKGGHLSRPTAEGKEDKASAALGAPERQASQRASARAIHVHVSTSVHPPARYLKVRLLSVTGFNSPSNGSPPRPPRVSGLGHHLSLPVPESAPVRRYRPPVALPGRLRPGLGPA
jgi:hypothetical protein